MNLRINLPILGLIIHTSASAADRGLIIFGYTYSFGVGSADAMLIRTDSLGNHIWVKTFGGPNPDFGKYVRQVSGGGYVILGETFLSGNFDLFLARTDMILIKTDGNGNLQWAKTYGGTLDDSARAIVRKLGKPPMGKGVRWSRR